MGQRRVALDEQNTIKQGKYQKVIRKSIRKLDKN